MTTSTTRPAGSLFGGDAGWATFSDDGAYRYELGRRWMPGGRLALFVMLNPSTADAMTDDPTIRRCVKFAQRFGANGLVVANLFAYRATDPTELTKVPDPVGPENRAHLREVIGRAGIGWHVAAWGAGATQRGIAQMARDEARAFYGATPWQVLGLTREGHPRHPLYLPGDAPLVAMP